MRKPVVAAKGKRASAKNRSAVPRRAPDGGEPPRRAPAAAGQAPAKAPSRRGRRFSEERRARVVEEAASLFLARGYDQVSIDDIVARIGGSKATIYSWFGDKDRLFETAIREYCARTSRELELQFNNRGTLESQLRRFSRKFLAVILSARSLDQHRLVVSIAERFPAVARAFHDAGPQSAYGIMERWVAEQQAGGRLRAGDARLMAVLYIDMLTAHHQLAALLGIGEELAPGKVEATVREAARVFVAAYAPVR